MATPMHRAEVAAEHQGRSPGRRGGPESCAVRSRLAVASRFPSGLKATLNTSFGFEWPRRTSNSLAAGGVPNLERAVDAAGGQPPAVRAERQRESPSVWPRRTTSTWPVGTSQIFRGLVFAAGGQRSAVGTERHGAGGGQPSAVGAERHGRYAAGMGPQPHQQPTAHQVPNHYGGVVAAGGEPFSVGAERQAADPL